MIETFELPDLPPALTLKEITVREVYEALEKNGLDWIRGRWFENGLDSDDGVIKPVGACIMGQGAVNLGVIGSLDDDNHPLNNLYNYIEQFDVGYVDDKVDTLIFYSLENQLNRFTVPVDNPYHLSYIAGLAETIIAWNDLQSGVYDYPYQITTYEEMLNIAKNLMEPFFDEKIHVLAVNKEIGLENRN